MRITGVVEENFKFDGKYGPMYSIKVNGTKYGTKKNRANAEAGDTVEFEASQNGQYWNVDGAVTKLDVPNVPQASRASSGTGTSSGSTGRWMDDEKKQGIISRQAAVNSATALMVLAKDLDVLPLPKTGKDRFDAFLGIHAKLRDQLNGYCVGETKSAEPVQTTEAATAAENDVAGW